MRAYVKAGAIRRSNLAKQCVQAADYDDAVETEWSYRNALTEISLLDLKLFTTVEMAIEAEEIGEVKLSLIHSVLDEDEELTGLQLDWLKEHVYDLDMGCLPDIGQGSFWQGRLRYVTRFDHLSERVIAAEFDRRSSMYLIRRPHGLKLYEIYDKHGHLSSSSDVKLRIVNDLSDTA